MTYRDLIDIPDIPFVPFDERFRQPVAADAPWPRRTPPLPKNGSSRPASAKKPRAPRPLADLDHRVAGCQGTWGKAKVNQFGHQVVFCWRCKATRITKRTE